jgi:hypothetical protein
VFSAEELDELSRKRTDTPYDNQSPADVLSPAIPFTLFHFTFAASQLRMKHIIPSAG